jgi:hypothetical protein
MSCSNPATISSVSVRRVCVIPRRTFAGGGIPDPGGAVGGAVASRAPPGENATPGHRALVTGQHAVRATVIGAEIALQ